MFRLSVIVAGLVLAGGAAAEQRTSRPADANGGAMLIEIQSEKSIAQLREDLPKAAAAHKFGVLAVHDLGAKLKEKGVEFGGEVLVFEVCNPLKAKAVLDQAPQASSLLPCRISAYKGANGKTYLSTMSPTKLIAGFGAAGLEPVAAEVERELVAIMNASR